MNLPTSVPVDLFANPANLIPFETIRRLLPYDPPLLLIDRAAPMGKEAISVQKAVSGADPLVAAHLTDGPAMLPGVLVIEMVGQAALLLAKLGGSAEPENPVVLGRCKARFNRPAFVGQTVTASLTVERAADGSLVRALVFADEDTMAEVELVAGPLKQKLR